MGHTTQERGFAPPRRMLALEKEKVGFGELEPGLRSGLCCRVSFGLLSVWPLLGPALRSVATSAALRCGPLAIDEPHFVPIRDSPVGVVEPSHARVSSKCLG